MARGNGLPALPRRVLGAVADYDVVLVSPDQLPEGAVGLHSGTGRSGARMAVSEDMNPDHRWQVFFHELVHKWELEGGFQLKDDDGDSDTDRLATAIYADFKRNGWTLPGGSGPV